MRTNHVLQAVSLTLAALLTPVLVSAQQASTDTPTDKPAKPAKPADKSTAKPADKTATEHQTTDGRKLEKLEDTDPPAVQIGKPPAENKITETRDDSGVRESKVQTGLTTYYVRPNTQIGSTLPGDTQSTTNRGAEWKVMEFNLGEKKKKPEEPPTDESTGNK